MEVVALTVFIFASLASIAVAALTLRAMARDNEELSAFVGFTSLPPRLFPAHPSHTPRA